MSVYKKTEMPSYRIRLFLFSALLLIGQHYAKAININPANQVGPTVQRWGWDTKGGSSRFNTIGKATVAYGNTPANLLRIPIEPTFHNADGSINLNQYQSDITAIKNVLAVNPDVEVFASVKLLGANTFPDWLGEAGFGWSAGTGQIFSNTVPRPNPVRYAELVANYVAMMEDEGIQIDYLGLNNETDGALGVSRYIGTVDALDSALDAASVPAEYRNFQLIGPDSFGLGTAESYVAGIDNVNRLDTVDIIGSHFYPQHSSGSADQWDNLADDYGKPLWHTEVHMPIGNAQYDGNREQALRDTLSVLFASNKQGVDSFVWWGYNSDANAIGQWVKSEVISTTLGATPINTTPGFSAKSDPNGQPLFQAYIEGSQVSLWISNPGNAITNETVSIEGGYLQLPTDTVRGETTSILPAEFRDVATDSGGGTITSALSLSADGTSFVIDSIPANSIGVITFNISTPGDINIDGVVDQLDINAFVDGWLSSQAEGDYDSWLNGDLNQDGTTDLSDFIILRNLLGTESQTSLISAFSTIAVPEPSTAMLFMIGVMMLSKRSRLPSY